MTITELAKQLNGKVILRWDDIYSRWEASLVAFGDTLKTGVGADPTDAVSALCHVCSGEILCLPETGKITMPISP